MKLKRFYLTTILSFFILFSMLGNMSLDSLKHKFKTQEQTSLLLFAAGYRMPVNKNVIINSGHGFYFEGGINPGHFISKKLVIGIYAGWAFKDGLWSTSFNKDFVNDYSASINKESNSSSLDSAVISSSANVFNNLEGKSVTMPGCQMRSFHNYSLYYGIMLKLPFKYIPIFKVYTGTTRSHYMGPGSIVSDQKEYNIFELRRMMYGCELILFRGLQSSAKDHTCKCPAYKNTGVLGVYYETCNFYKSSLYFDDGTQQRSIHLSNFVSQSFLQKYRNEISWGFKLSFCIM